MAFTVRVFGYRGLTQLPQNLPKQFTGDTVFTDTEPYEWRDAQATNGVTPVSTPPQAAPDQTQYIRVEVPDGQSIRYEVKPPGSARVVDANSPILAGINRFEFHQGWVFSYIDATGT